MLVCCWQGHSASNSSCFRINIVVGVSSIWCFIKCLKVEVARCAVAHAHITATSFNDPCILRNIISSGVSWIYQWRPLQCPELQIRTAQSSPDLNLSCFFLHILISSVHLSPLLHFVSWKFNASYISAKCTFVFCWWWMSMYLLHVNSLFLR